MSRIFLIAAIVYQKFCDNSLQLNKIISILADIRLEEINILEKEFLRIIEYDLYITDEEHQEYVDALIKFFEDQENDSRILMAI